MNHCRRCESDYEKPGTCNCFAEKAAPDDKPWLAPIQTTPTIPWWQVYPYPSHPYPYWSIYPTWWPYSGGTGDGTVYRVGDTVIGGGLVTYTDSPATTWLRIPDPDPNEPVHVYTGNA